MVGIDADEASVREAAARVPAELADRVRFAMVDARHADAEGPFDLVVILETLHDIGDPGAALRGIHAALADGGTVIVVDERVAETFTAPGDAVERMMFGWSVVHCLPAAIADGDHRATGTALRPSALARLAAASGFSRFELLPIDDELFRFYRLEV